MFAVEPVLLLRTVGLGALTAAAEWRDPGFWHPCYRLQCGLQMYIKLQKYYTFTADRVGFAVV